MNEACIQLEAARLIHCKQIEDEVMESNIIIGSVEAYTYSTYVAFFLIWVASIIFILLRSLFSKTHQAKLRLPPSPLGLPLIGHFHLLRPAPLHQAFHNLCTRYGPILLLYLGSLPCVVISSGEIAKHILKTHDISFSNRPSNAAIAYLTYDASDFAFAPYGTYWKFMKKLCMTQLLNGVMLDHLLPVRQEEINQFLEVILKKAHVGEAVDLGSELVRLTSSVVMRMAIGKSLFDSNSEEEAREVSERVKESAKLSGRFNLGDYFGVFKILDVQGIGKKLKRVRDRSDAMFESIIREHQHARSNNCSKPKDILDLLLTISEDQSSEVKITRNNIKGFMADITSGGTGTIALGIEWAMAEVINNPSVMEKARKEIDSVIGKERIVKESDIVKLPYLEAIVKETLRLHPPGPVIMRESTEKCKIGGYDIPEKTRVFINVWALGRDPQYWDNPLEFCPERFERKEMDVRGQHYNLLPFGSGRRGCPGASLALNVLHTTLAAMIQCFEWKVPGRVDMQEGHAVDLQRAKPLISIPKPRLTPFPSFSSS